MDEVNNNTNDNIEISGKAEEHPSVVDINSNSKSMENEPENPCTDEEVVALSVGGKGVYAKLLTGTSKKNTVGAMVIIFLRTLLTCFMTATVMIYLPVIV